MKRIRTVRLLFPLCLYALLTACRLEVIVGDGGAVQSLSGAMDCPSVGYCITEIDDVNFSESFTAIANPGYEFLQWNDGHGFFCSGSTNMTCNVTLHGDAQSAAILATRVSGHIMPMFRYIGLDTDDDGIDDRDDTDDDNDDVLDENDLCPRDPSPACGVGEPITETVIVAGREWAQPRLFTELSWAQINTVCPEGECIEGGILNGHDMSDWRWAHIYDVTVLFNHYNSDIEVHRTGWREEDEGNSAWILAFIDDGWQSVFPPSPEFYIAGFVWGDVHDEDGFFTFPYGVVQIGNSMYNSEMNTSGMDGPNDADDSVGAWFYRSE